MTCDIYTFGHSTRSADDTVMLLRSHEITQVVDVRSIRGSRHNPQFGADTMAGWLADASIHYAALPSLGGRRRGQHTDPDINAGWRHPSFHHYADYALTDEFAAGIADLEALAAESVTAFMCAEAVPWRCHRSLVATVLVTRGWRVRHLLSEGALVDHEIGRWGATPVVESSGRVTYPAAPGHTDGGR